ncbi:hypothetical protein N7537_006763 [Penicillium hordei]|uniref:Uncharacterized protein n=1 Tax=Penicillium hordei TaxID=40994 RepID=A0AAD6H4G9_9EURO|nr:uncharacterized protein N7537_006763 [Penicillium hordei]KAJ5603807.1 hypothetical protein N7537_006763 [Penicillium hordei]
MSAMHIYKTKRYKPEVFAETIASKYQYGMPKANVLTPAERFVFVGDRASIRDRVGLSVFTRVTRYAEEQQPTQRKQTHSNPNIN